MTDAILVLSDGEYFWGNGVGATGTALGEICFNTGMTGYQEVLTDPSYADQIIVFTFPHIGNVGINAEDDESGQLYCNGLVIREPITDASNFRSHMAMTQWLVEKGIVGICNIDTRALTQSIRDNGARSALIYHAKPNETINVDQLLDRVKQEPTLLGKELAGTVTTQAPYPWSEMTYQFNQTKFQSQDQSSFHVVVIDFGVKRNILRCLADAGLRLTVVPAQTSIESIVALKPDGVFLSNGPGDPFETAQYSTPVIQALLEKDIPIFGICLGHQLLAIATNLKTIKMSKGHRGANQPVKNIETGQVEITSQNHGFCVSNEHIPPTVKITHISLFDQSIEGIELVGKPAFSVQYHPESSPGPHDSRNLFKKFVNIIEKSKQKQLNKA